jgi:hypothetical protein
MTALNRKINAFQADYWHLHQLTFLLLFVSRIHCSMQMFRFYLEAFGWLNAGVNLSHNDDIDLPLPNTICYSDHRRIVV